MNSNRSNTSDKPVRVMVVYASGKVKQRAVRASAHALADETPSPEVSAAGRVKDPRKVAAGKARAAQAKAAREVAARTTAQLVKAPVRTAKVTVAKSPKPKAKPAAVERTRNEPSATAMVVIAFRGTKAQKKKFAKLGGGEWARGRIEAATVRA